MVRRSHSPVWVGRWIVLFVVLAATMSACGQGGAAPTAQDARTKIRVGFPIATLLNGQIGQILARTNVLEQHSLDGTVTNFAYGSPMMEAMAAGEIDVALTTDGPSMLLVSKGVAARVVGSLGTFRSTLLVPADSPIQSSTDLKGRTVAVSFGSTPHMHTLLWLKEAGLDPANDVELINLATGELEPALASGRVDAIAHWEPNVSQIIKKTQARVVAENKLTSIVLIRQDFLEQNRDAAKEFMVALQEAALYLAMRQMEVNGWFSEASRIDTDVIDSASLHSPIYTQPKSLEDINLGLTQDVLTMLEQTNAFFIEQGSVQKAADLSAVVDQNLWQESQALPRKSQGIEQIAVVGE